MTDSVVTVSYIGHESAEAQFLESWASGRLHHAWLLAGPQGMGKARFARRIVRFLLTRPTAAIGGAEGAADSLDASGDAKAERLLEAGSHSDYIYLHRAEKATSKSTDKAKNYARNITVEQIRTMLASMHMTIAIGHWRVVLVDAADDLELPAANALLKILEEPPPRTLFLLVSHAPGRLLATIRSRCLQLRFPPLSADRLRAWLASAYPDASPAQIDSTIAAAGGVIGKARTLIAGDSSALEGLLNKIADSGDRDTSLRSELVRLVSRDDQNYRLLLDIAPALLLRRAQKRPVAELEPYFAQWSRLHERLNTAISGSYDPAMIGFDIGSCFAILAEHPRTLATHSGG